MVRKRQPRMGSEEPREPLFGMRLTLVPIQKAQKIRAADVFEGGEVPQIQQSCEETPLLRGTHRGRVWKDGMGKQEKDRMVF